MIAGDPSCQVQRSKQLTRGGEGSAAAGETSGRKKVPSGDRLLSGLVFTVFVRGQREAERFSLHGPLVIEQQWRRDARGCRHV